MGKYDRLSDREKEILRRMVDARSSDGDASWVLGVTFGSSELLATEGQSIDDVPRSEAFYVGLAEKDFIALGWTSKGNPQVSLQQSAIDYAEYASMSTLRRWWADRKYELLEEATLSAKLFWIFVGLLLTIAFEFVMKLLS